jgi:class 3 adenylate cyclase
VRHTWQRHRRDSVGHHRAGSASTTTLFVDIAGSTSLLVQHPAEAVLGVVQCSMRLVTEVAYACGGTVKD